MKNKIKMYTLAVISSGITLASCAIWYNYLALPAIREAFQMEAVNRNAAQFNPKTRAFEWVADADLFLSPELPRK